MRNNSIILLLFLISATLLLSACGNKQYDEAMENGIDSIKDEKYEEAAGFFQEALDKKESDDKASTYLEQTESFIDGIEYMDDGNIDEANQLFEEIVNKKDGLSDIEEVADEKMDEIEELKKLYGDAEDRLESAKTENEKGQYDEALEAIKDGLDADLSDSYVEDLKNDLEALKEEVEENKELKKQAEKALSQAKQLEEEEAYDEAISEVDQVLDKGLEPSGLKGIKQDLKELKSRLDEKKEEKLAKEKEQQFADNLQGYWAEDAPDVTPGIEIGKVTSEEWMFAILASDVAAYAEIDSLDVDEDNNQINIKTTDGHVVEVTNFDGDKMTVGDTELHKFTKEEMEAKVGDSVSVMKFLM